MKTEIHVIIFYYCQYHFGVQLRSTPKNPVLVEKMAEKGACEKKYCEINENSASLPSGSFPFASLLVPCSQMGSAEVRCALS